LDHLSPEDIMPLLLELTNHGTRGLWTTLDVLTMYLHGDRRPSDSIVALVKSVLVAAPLFDEVLRGSSDGHRLQEAVRLLDRHGALDRKFARAVLPQLFGICGRSEPSVFHELDAPAREALRILMRSHPKEVWAAVSKLLLRRDWRFRDRLGDLLGFDREDHLGPGILFDLPPELYVEWARGNPDKRAATVVEWLPLVQATEPEGTAALSWHPALESFVAAFAEATSVLGAVARRLRRQSGSGSEVPHLERVLPLLDTWSKHSRPGVRSWAANQKAALRTAIEDERRHDEEHDVRL
jgi:hypothetical protein